jgi:hypothetical protein
MVSRFFLVTASFSADFVSISPLKFTLFNHMLSQRKTVAPSALILTPLVGSLVVSGGEAKANVCPSLNLPPPPGPCLLGFFDPNIQVKSLDQFTPINVAALPAGTNVTIGLTGNFQPRTQKQIVPTFAPAFVGS